MIYRYYFSYHLEYIICFNCYFSRFIL